MHARCSIYTGIGPLQLGQAPSTSGHSPHPWSPTSLPKRRDEGQATFIHEQPVRHPANIAPYVETLDIIAQREPQVPTKRHQHLNPRPEGMQVVNEAPLPKWKSSSLPQKIHALHLVPATLHPFRGIRRLQQPKLQTSGTRTRTAGEIREALMAHPDPATTRRSGINGPQQPRRFDGVEVRRLLMTSALYDTKRVSCFRTRVSTSPCHHNTVSPFFAMT